MATEDAPTLEWTDAPAPERIPVEISPQQRLFIDGAWTAGSGRKRFDTVNYGTVLADDLKVRAKEACAELVADSLFDL